MAAGIAVSAAAPPSSGKISSGKAGKISSGKECVAFGRWMAPASGTLLAYGDVLADMAARPVVLLGESHSSMEDHRWQLQTLAALHAGNPNMVVGFESFPRRVQPVLDQWVRGELDERNFLEKTEWYDVWRYDAGLYMPLFHFVRLNRIPMIALNVGHDLVRKVRREGWANIPSGKRAGLGDPAPASEGYRKSLREILESHRDKMGAAVGDEGFQRFVEAQLTWDRAMAEKLAEARTAGGEPLVVGIVGRGHAEYGFGIPHQLSDLGISGTAVLLPWEADRACSELESHGMPVADAVFGTVAEPPKELVPPKPRLGVMIDDSAKEIRVRRVLDNSVAEETGLAEGDVIVKAAGVPVRRNQDLVAIIRRQAPGTWLPLVVRRDDDNHDLIAKFPPLK